MNTALAIVLDDAEPFDAVRREFAVEAVALGIPFHITLLDVRLSRHAKAGA
jgi:hypothetical protein